MRAVLVVAMCCGSLMIFGLGAVNGVARSGPLSRQDLAAQERLSAYWPSELQSVARNVVLFGDGKLDPATVRLLVRMVDRHRLQNPQAAHLSEQTFWRLMTSMPTSIESDSKLMDELRARARASRDLLDASIFLARARSGEADANEDTTAVTVVKRSQAIRDGGDTAIKNDESGRAVAYLVIANGTSLRTIEQLIANDGLLPFVVDACSLNAVTSKVRDGVIDLALKATDRETHRSLVSLVIQKESPEAKALLDKLRSTLPQKTVDGQQIFVLSTGSLESALYSTIQHGYDIIDLKKRYIESRADKRTTDFFRTKEKNVELTMVKAWLLYRYCATDFKILYDDVKRSSQLVLGDNWYLGTLLAGTLKYASLVSTEGIECDAIREYLARAETPENRVNALVLLEAIASDEDIPILHTLAADVRDVTWKASGRQHNAPLVAIRAVQCLAAIRSSASTNALNEIAKDTSVPQKAREVAFQTLGKQAGERISK